MENYIGQDEELANERLRARKLTRLYNQTMETDYAERTALLKELFGSTEKNCYIEPTFRCDYGYNIHVGENFYANFDCVILDTCEVRIGQNCMLALVFIFIQPHTRSTLMNENQEMNMESRSQLVTMSGLAAERLLIQG